VLLGLKKMIAELESMELTYNEVFDAADVNGDGFLDARELGELFTTLKVADVNCIMHVFKGNDTKNKLTREEFT